MRPDRTAGTIGLAVYGALPCSVGYGEKPKPARAAIKAAPTDESGQLSQDAQVLQQDFQA